MTVTTAITTGRPPGDLPERRPAGRGFDWGQPVVYLVALVVAALAIGPVVYVFIGGFRTTADLNADPAGMPDPWTIQNWVTVLGAPRFWGNVFASVVLAAGTTLFAVIVLVLIGWAEHWFERRAKR